MTTNVTDFNPRSQGGTREELLARFASTGLPSDATAARRSGASSGELRKAQQAYLAAQQGRPGRYIVATDWEHTFADGIARRVRFIFDRELNRIHRLDLLGDSGFMPCISTGYVEDLEVSIKQGNDDMLSNPDHYGLAVFYVLPAW